jgi:hypothetical protein
VAAREDPAEVLRRLNSQIQKSLTSEQRATADPELLESLESLNWYIAEWSKPPPSARSIGHAFVTPEVIQQAINVVVWVGGAVLTNRIAHADNAVTQAFLRRRKRDKAPTSNQIKHVARFRINMEWPSAEIKFDDDPYSESRGPNGWSVAWLKGEQLYSVDGDNDLATVNIRRESRPLP